MCESRKVNSKFDDLGMPSSDATRDCQHDDSKGDETISFKSIQDPALFRLFSPTSEVKAGFLPHKSETKSQDTVLTNLINLKKILDSVLKNYQIKLLEIEKPCITIEFGFGYTSLAFHLKEIFDTFNFESEIDLRKKKRPPLLLIYRGSITEEILKNKVDEAILAFEFYQKAALASDPKQSKEFYELSSKLGNPKARKS